MAGKGDYTDRRKEIEKDISSYIATRRKKENSFFSRISKAFGSGDNVNVKLHPEVESYGPEKEEKKKKEEEKESLEEAEEALEEEFEQGSRPGMLSRIRNFFFEPEPEVPVEEDFSEEEVRKVIEEEKRKKEQKEKEEAEKAQEEEGDSSLEEEYVEGAREKGMIAGFLSKLFGKAEKENSEESAEEIAEGVETIEDLKEVAEISTKVMKMLPAEKVKELKESDDFKKFKDILKKHSLIK